MSKNNNPQQKVVLFLVCLVAPFLLLPFEKVLPYSFILEELFKVVVVFYIFKLNKKNIISSLKDAAVCGVLFTISETILYLPNFFMVGNVNEILLRLISTGLLHVIAFVILVPLYSISVFIAAGGFLLNIFIHLAFNLGIERIAAILRF